MKDSIIEFQKALVSVPNIESDFIQVIASYSTPLVSPNFDEPLKTNHGCGTLAIISQKHGILTAAHVADIFNQRDDNFIYIPFEDKLHRITYNKIILLPRIEGMVSIDLAFIVLDNEKFIIESGKKFLSLTHEGENPKKNHLFDLQCGFYALPGQDKLVTYSNSSQTLNYKFGGVYLGNPDKDSYLINSFYFPISYPQHLQDRKITFDQFTVTSEKWENLPDRYSGTSGGGFWGAELIPCEDKKFRLINIKLLGVMVEEQRGLRKLIGRGPVSLYEIFLKFCSTALETDDSNQALNKIFSD